MATSASSSTSTPSYSSSAAIGDSELIDSLLHLSKKSPKLVKSTEAAVPGCEEITVRSWKMNEFKYYDIPSPFPTLARGLFTTDAEDDADEEVKHRIVIRGYDKFFNIGEVPWTTWEALKEHTAAPYVLSLKSNGCIIFIAAITPRKLIVTSKHSVGIGNETVSHAMVGRKWLNKYLKENDKTEADLAEVLWKNRWTAVAELCDDSFEEHVLPYPPEKTGLHLHGINVCTKTFQTLPTSAVDAFADEWGFIKTATIVLDTIEEVQEFTSKVGETGKWDGEAVEGFVVRTYVTEPPNERKKGGARGETERVSKSLSPYKPGSSFFFKVKFDEPYMMYRDWREVTKALLGIKARGEKMVASKLPKGKMRRPETQAYVKWVIGDIERHPELFMDYGKGKGIIATRERFLRFLEGTDVGDAAPENVEEPAREFGKTIIVPIAIPGCGKTTVSLALAHLFGWGHTQSDNVQAKKAGPVFIKNVVGLLKDHDVVIADKNNHLKQHRQGLRDAVSHNRSFIKPVRLIALNWDIHSQAPALVHRICSERIWNRGERHQTLVPDVGGDRGGKTHHEEVVWMFLNSAEELTGDEVDDVVEMEIAEDPKDESFGEGEENELGVTSWEGEEAESGMVRQVRRAVEGVCGILGMDVPSNEKIREAVEHVRRYEDELALRALNRPGSKKSDKSKMKEAFGGAAAKKKKDVVRYYGLLPEVNLVKLVDSTLEALAESKESDADREVRENLEALWAKLKSGNRPTKRPHVTLVHKNQLKDIPAEDDGGGNVKDLWEACAEVHELEGSPLFEGRLGSLVWNERVLAVTFEDVGLPIPPPDDDGQQLIEEGLEQLSLNSSAPSGPSKRAFKSASIVLSNINADEPLKERLHVTIGTRDGKVSPVEAKTIVEEWRRRGAKEGADGDGDERIWAVSAGGVRVKGLVKGLIS
ncbi:hypothetical protein EST38_g9030 [Candolleomyces aberdarensis]|uniref:RNA ligase (ATP) n=1 Tax=Candolleomyces aberdarensis TaxID=2316362 RepID=A0A4Q2DDU0_9AGAR|nr:hypothetical protein EST38_g9030 [Candolleomyces aberdarensis]